MKGDRVPIAVLASGRGSNFEAILRASLNPDFPAQIAVAISDVEDAYALECAERAGVDSLYVPPGPSRARLSARAEELILGELSRRRVQLVALAGFMRIISERFLASFPGSVLNIHPSLLPSFPGLEAQSQALRHGVKISGCTVHFVDKGIDTGPIIAQAVVPVERDDTVDSLAGRILEEEHRIYPEAIRSVLCDQLG